MNNTSCLGLPVPWANYAEQSMKDVSLKTVYLSYSQGHERDVPSGVNPNPAASWRAKYDYMLVKWHNDVEERDKQIAILEAANAAFFIELSKKPDEIAALKKELAERTPLPRPKLPTDDPS